METDLAKMYISRIISMTFYDRNTGKVLDEWDFDKCKDLNVEMEVLAATTMPEHIEQSTIALPFQEYKE